MKRLLQRLRGAIGTAITWSAGWCAAGMLIGTTGLFGELALVDYAIFGGVFAGLGFIGGGAFSVVVSLTEGRRRFEQMSMPRFAMWGALGAVIMYLTQAALGQGSGLVTVAFFALLGAASSAGSLALARRAEDQELLGSAEEIAEVGLSREEARELLGE